MPNTKKKKKLIAQSKTLGRKSTVSRNLSLLRVWSGYASKCLGRFRMKKLQFKAKIDKNLPRRDKIILSFWQLPSSKIDNLFVLNWQALKLMEVNLALS